MSGSGGPCHIWGRQVCVIMKIMDAITQLSSCLLCSCWEPHLQGQQSRLPHLEVPRGGHYLFVWIQSFSLYPLIFFSHSVFCYNDFAHVSSPQCCFLHSPCPITWWMELAEMLPFTLVRLKPPDRMRDSSPRPMKL